MAAGNKKPEDQNTGTADSERSLRDDAEDQLASLPKHSSDLKGQTPEQLIHELQVHQIELEIQAEELKKSKLALEESRDKFLDLYDFAPTGILTISEKELIVEVNLTGSTLLGVGRSELVMTRFSKFVAPEDQDQWYWYITNLLRQEGKQCCTLRLKYAGGSAFPARLEGVRLGSGGIRTEARIAFSDITDMRDKEDALRMSEEKYRNLFTAESDAIFLVDKKTGSILEVNDAACRLYEYSYEEIIHLRNSDLSAEPDDTQAATNILRDRIPLRYHKKKSGTIFPVEISASRFVLKDREIIVAAIRDITERKLAEEVLRESEEKFRLISESSPDHIFIQDRDLRYIWVLNPQLGLRPKDMIGKTDYDILSKKDADLVTTVKRQVLETGKTIHYETSLSSSLGETEYFEGVYLPKYDNEGKINGVRGYFRNITKRKQAEEALQKSETQLRATLESTADGILAVDNKGKVLQVSRRFAEIWKIPPSILESGDDRTMLDFVLDQLNDPDAFLKKVQLLYDSDAVDMDILTFKDGRVFERYTSPMIMDGARIGRVWSFRDVSERKRAEETLRESEERFRLLLQHVPSVSVQGYSMDGTTQYWNDASESLYGYTAQEAVGKNLVDLIIPPEMKDDVRKAMTYMAESGQPIPAAELSLMRKDGTRVAVFSSHAIVKRSGSGTELFCIDIDLTERKVAEAAFRQLSADHKVIIDHAPAMVWYKDTKNNFIRVNPAGALAFGLPVEEIEGKSTYDLFPDFAEKYYQDDLDVINSGKPRLGIIEPMTTASGEHLWVQTDKIPLMDEQGTITGILLFAVDITGRKRAEDALRESEERFRTIIHSMQFGIVIIDEQTHTIIEANPKALEMIGGNSESVAGSVCHRFICPAELGKCPVTDLGQNVDSSERVLLNLRGEKVPILKSVIRTTLGGKDVLIESFIDITERKKAEEALALAIKKLALLSGITRHDINNQLTVLRGYLDILRMKQPDPTLNEYFGKAATAAQCISSMIQFTKEYEKIGVHAPVWQDCRTVVDTVAKQAPLGKVMMKNDLPVGTEVFADPLIVKVFYNLMDNAVRYGGKITTIRFSVEEADDHVIICEDDGDGVVAEEKEKIFERGFGKNTGLGLALSREILSITGITIRETGEPGKGARFEMTVPKGMWK
jgi:PAS domain S-box-containing protein